MTDRLYIKNLIKLLCDPYLTFAENITIDSIANNITVYNLGNKFVDFFNFDTVTPFPPDTMLVLSSYSFEIYILLEPTLFWGGGGVEGAPRANCRVIN